MPTITTKIQAGAAKRYEFYTEDGFDDRILDYYTDSSDGDFVSIYAGVRNDDDWVGSAFNTCTLGFANVAFGSIPAGSTITSAYVRFKYNGDDLGIFVPGQAGLGIAIRALNISGPGSSLGETDPATVSPWTDPVTWATIPDLEFEDDIADTPDISAIIQTLLDNGHLGDGTLLLWIEPPVTDPGYPTGWTDTVLERQFKTVADDTPELIITYDPPPPVYVDRGISWDVAETINVDRDVSWDVAETINADRTLSWSVRTPVTADRSLAWSVQQQVNADRSLAWDVRQAVVADRTLSWSVRQQVNADRELIWTTIGKVLVDRLLSWDVRKAIEADRALSWSVRTPVEADRTLSWSVRQQINADRELIWDTIGRVLVDRDIQWSVRTSLDVDRTLAWAVRALVEIDRELEWATRQRIDVDRRLIWTTIGYSTAGALRVRAIDPVLRQHHASPTTRVQGTDPVLRVQQE